MKTFIEELRPRTDQDTGVMNVKVVFKVPENEGRLNTVEVTVFVDKAEDSMADISRLSLEKARDLLRTIVDHHP